MKINHSALHIANAIASRLGVTNIPDDARPGVLNLVREAMQHGADNVIALAAGYREAYGTPAPAEAVTYLNALIKQASADYGTPGKFAEPSPADKEKP